MGDSFPAGYDGGCAEVDGGVPSDGGGTPDGSGTTDGGGTKDGGVTTDAGGTADGGVADGGGCGSTPAWPPDQKTDPWYAGRVCKLPACDEGVVSTCHDSSGTWTQKLTTISHSCGKMAEAFDQRLKPGNVTSIQGVTFNSVGECEYSADNTLVGVIKGATGISCTVGTEPDGLGGTMTRMETGVATSYADYELRFDRN
ncbi:MAG: hypothetical protein HY897_11770 [Deltaproteobacteria bacterium]|nr:hypothetical protein [Deltaproteobacteria bacterium]